MITEIGEDGQERKVRAFNTETAEQLNSWLKGYRTAVNRMTDYNHDFFLYCVLFLHSEDIKIRRAERERRKNSRQRNRGVGGEDDGDPLEDQSDGSGGSNSSEESATSDNDDEE